MICPYKITISNQNLYREFEISKNTERVCLGTTASCEFRLNKDDFFCTIELLFELHENEWRVICNDEVYLSVGDARKIGFAKLNHGDSFSVKYASSGSDVFEMKFEVDFEAQIPKFDCFVELSNVSRITIGDTEKNDLVLKGSYCNNTGIALARCKNGFRIEESKSTYGVNINGIRVSSNEVIGECDFLSVSDVFLYFKDDKLFFDGNKVASSCFQIRECEGSGVFDYPVFVRNTRRKIKVDTTPIKILDPGKKPSKPEMNLLTSLFPTIIMFIMVIIFRGIMNSNMGTYVIFSICSMGIGVFTSIVNVVQGQKKYKNDIKQREEVYKDYISRKEKEVWNARESEIEALTEIYYSPACGIEKAISFDPDIFDRIPSDDDFMDVCLGVGKRISKRPLEYKPQEQLEIGDELTELPAQLEEKYRYIDNAPITMPLKNVGAVGIAGDAESRYQLFKNIVADLCCRQFHTEIEMSLLLEDEADKYAWIKQLPQLQRADGSRSIVFDENSRTNVFEKLFKELTYRCENKGEYKPLVIFAVEDNEIVNHPLSKFIEIAVEIQTTFIFFEDSLDYIPQHCSYIIELEGSKNGKVYRSSDRTKRELFTYEHVADSKMQMLVQKLAPIYSEEKSLASTLRKNISLYEMLGIYLASDIDLARNWASSNICDTMAAPLGINSKNEIVYLDLHEKAHGPHGLVAGTTGSGKSEILQTYILSMATLYHPYEVSFVIIDFKGGGMVNQFSNLPHLVGAITNIDGKEIDRSLKSIRAELMKRQTLFAEVGVNNIEKYIKAYKSGYAKTALPHLIIIVDEFAELKAEQPEFMKELISASRIGRSLGVHLILATQKPAGQVSEQIWSNSKFKLCLKVQDQQDSKEVIKSPLAAEIKEPGRAYLQVGNNEIFELFQSAYSGGRAIREEKQDKQPITIFEYSMGGRNSVLYQQKFSTAKKETETELEAIVNHIADYCNTNRIERLDPICMPSLADEIDYPEHFQSNLLHFNIPVGIYDDPENQRQAEYRLDLGNENVLAIGSVQTGKTNFIQLILRAIGQQFDSEDVNVYIVDFASMTLKMFEKMKHVGGVVIPGEDEKLKNLFKLLKNSVQERKEKLLAVGVSSFGAYVEAGYSDYPRIIVMMDNFAVFKELYEETYEADFQFLTREGPTYGICFIVTNGKTAGFGYKYMSNFGTRIAFNCNESTEYGNLFDRCRTEPKDTPGRILFKKQNAIYECQTYLAFEGRKEVERAAAMHEFIDITNLNCTGKPARLIPSVPDVLTLGYLEENYRIPHRKYVYSMALDYSTVDVVNVDANSLGEICIVGRDSTKREKVLTSILSAMSYWFLDDPIQLFILDSFARPFKHWADHPYTDKYTVDCDSLVEAFTNCKEELEQRQQWLKNEEMDRLENAPLLLFVINNEMAVEAISNSKEMTNIYQDIVKLGKALKVLFVFSAIDDVTAGYTAPTFLKKLRDNRKAFIVSKLPEVKLYDIPISTSRNFKAYQPGDVYYLDGNDITRLKLIEEVEVN